MCPKWLILWDKHLNASKSYRFWYKTAPLRTTKSSTQPLFKSLCSSAAKYFGWNRRRLFKCLKRKIYDPQSSQTSRKEQDRLTFATGALLSSIFVCTVNDLVLVTFTQPVSFFFFFKYLTENTCIRNIQSVHLLGLPNSYFQFMNSSVSADVNDS